MNEKIMTACKHTRDWICKHSPEILTGVGIIGGVTTVITAVKVTPKVYLTLNKAEEEKGQPLTKKEIIKIGWKPYLPSMLMGGASICCVIGATAINRKRTAALSAAYAISENALLRYRDKVIETLGEKEDKKIRQKISEDDVKNDKPEKDHIIITSKGNTLCKDSISGRYFRSDVDKIRKVINELNREITHQNYISLNKLYENLGLTPIKNGDNLGWNIDDGLIEINFDACLTEDEEPCIVVDYDRLPKSNYDRFN